jgi:AcrR family transcriptional regulator
MPKVVNHDEYRRNLLEKCFYIFSSKGYSNATMREIAKEIGVSTGTIYHYFPTKQHILEQMFEYIMETNVGEYISRAESTNTDTVEGRLQILIDLVIEFEEYYKHVLLLTIDLYRINGSGDAEKVITRFSEYYNNAIAEQIDVSDQLAKSIFIYIVGLIFHSILTPDYIQFSEHMSILKNMLEIVISKPEEADGEAKHILFERSLKNSQLI